MIWIGFTKRVIKGFVIGLNVMQFRKLFDITKNNLMFFVMFLCEELSVSHDLSVGCLVKFILTHSNSDQVLHGKKEIFNWNPAVSQRFGHKLANI